MHFIPNKTQSACKQWPFLRYFHVPSRVLNLHNHLEVEDLLFDAVTIPKARNGHDLERSSLLKQREELRRSTMEFPNAENNGGVLLLLLSTDVTLYIYLLWKLSIRVYSYNT